MGKPVILTFVDYYVPGYRAGGPMRTVSNMVQRLGKEFAFRIITRDRDFGDTHPYAECMLNMWQHMGDGLVMYLSPPQQRLGPLWQIISQTPHDAMYLNSFFSPRFTIIPLLLRRVGLIVPRPVIVAPRGEFSEAALRLRRGKKRAYLRLAGAAGLYSDVIWQASSAREEQDIRRWFGANAEVYIAADPCGLNPRSELETVRLEKRPGSLRVVFLSRICRMKNLLGALDVLKSLSGDVSFHIFGPFEDKTYWSECCRRIEGLPKNVRAEYRGPIPHEQVSEVFRQYHLLLLPTLGENFGHVVLEALSAGCPVLISDRTPWRGLETAGVGWDVSLDQPGQFQAVLRRCLAMDQQEFCDLSSRAGKYGRAIGDDDSMLEHNRRMFVLAMRARRAA